jgi:hypothetical protein
MSEVRKDTNGTGISNESHHQTVAIQRLGHGHDQQNQPSIQQGSPVHFGHHGLPMKSVTSKDVVILSKSMLFIGLGFLRPSRAMEDRPSYSRNSGSSPLTWGSSWSDRLHTMPKQMGKPRRPIRALSSWSRGKLMNTLGIGTKFYQKHCGHTVFHVMEQQKLWHIIWCMDRRSCYHGRLRPAQDV